MNSNDKYNILVREVANSKDKDIYPKTFGMDYQEFKAIIDEIEKVYKDARISLYRSMSNINTEYLPTVNP